MGVFSFLANDSGRSIPCNPRIKPIPIWMWIPDEKQGRYEPAYAGYGDFDGLDYYTAVAKLNRLGKGDEERLRNLGIQFTHAAQEEGPQPGSIFPQLTETPLRPPNFSKAPDFCPYQGFFYDSGTEPVGALAPEHLKRIAAYFSCEEEGRASSH